MSTFTITLFDNYAARTKREECVTPAALIDVIRNTAAPSKDALPWLKLARFGDNPSKNGCLRYNSNVIEITGLEGDYDGEVITMARATEILEKVGIEAIVYPSPSWALDKPRWRILCPFSRSLPPSERDRMMGRLEGSFRQSLGLTAVFADESWPLSQSFYFGYVTNGVSPPEPEYVEGIPIDLLDKLDALQVARPNGTGRDRENGKDHTPGPPEAPIEDIAAALGAISNPCPHWSNPEDSWTDWNTIGMAVWTASGGSRDGFTLFDQWSAKYQTKYDPDETLYRWNHYPRSPPSEIGAGTLFYLASQFQPGWASPSRRLPGGDQGRSALHLPTIRLRGGNRPEAAAAGIEALKDAPFYQRSDKIVYIRRTPAKTADGSEILIPSILQVPLPYLQNELGERAEWQKFDGRSKKWVRVDVPYEIATAVAAMPNDWCFPPVTGVTNTQTMRPDGTLLTEPGYDPQTGFVLFEPPSMQPIPAAPSRHDAVAALQLLDELLDEFPFANQASRSVALSLILSLVLRPALAPAVPLHITNAPEGGTGKSYIFDVASVLAIGELTPVLCRGHTSEETEKRLIGAALEGRLLLMLDNCNGELRSEFLCQAIERPVIKPRPLGTTTMPTIPNGFVCGANGNNIEIADDLVRRSLLCDLDANMEQPYLRDFKRNPVRDILRDRGRYIAAALTIVRAYIMVGKPDRPLPLSSFEAWSDLVRGPLIWLGRADPVETIRQLVNTDPAREQRANIFQSIGFNCPGNFTVADVIRASMADTDLRGALVTVARGKSGEGTIEIMPERLAGWLKKSANRIAGGLKLLRVDEPGARVTSWVLQPISDLAGEDVNPSRPRDLAGSAGSACSPTRALETVRVTVPIEYNGEPANPTEPAEVAKRRWKINLHAIFNQEYRCGDDGQWHPVVPDAS
jgi:putative DNA primase/helicase